MARFKWNWSTESEIYRNIVRRVPGVGASTYAEAQKRTAVAEAIMAPHHANNAPRRKPGDSVSYLTTSRGGQRVDAFINLHDADGGALAIEGEIAPLRKAVGRR